MLHVCSAREGQRRVPDPHKLELQKLLAVNGSCILNPGPLKEQHVLLNVEHLSSPWPTFLKEPDSRYMTSSSISVPPADFGHQNVAILKSEMLPPPGLVF